MEEKNAGKLEGIQYKFGENIFGKKIHDCVESCDIGSERRWIGAKLKILSIQNTWEKWELVG